MQASVKGIYDAETSGAISTLAVNAGDVQLRASVSDSPFVALPTTLAAYSFSLEKPGSFVFDYNGSKNDVKFQFLDTVRVLGRPLNLTYTHWWRDKRAAVDGTLVLDSGNKVLANYAFDSGNCKLKYSYMRGGKMAIEPCYNFADDSWDFTVSKRFCSEDMIRALYQTSSRNLGVEWSRSSKLNGAFKISASLNLAEELKFPRLNAETTWSFDM